MFVDSPGIGESEQMTSLVKEYMEQAVGFIYVLNAANAGGVAPDRVSGPLTRLLSQIVHSPSVVATFFWHLNCTLNRFHRYKTSSSCMWRRQSSPARDRLVAPLNMVRRWTLAVQSLFVTNGIRFH